MIKVVYSSGRVTEIIKLNSVSHQPEVASCTFPYSPLQEAFQKEIRANAATLVQGPSAGQQRKRHANLQDRVQGLWNSTRLFEKALGLFEGRYSCKCVCV